MVLSDTAGKRLFISDTNHHRIVVTDLDGGIEQTIGSGAIGLKDGSFKQAEFYQPQGLALTADGKTLYVADTKTTPSRDKPGQQNSGHAGWKWPSTSRPADTRPGQGGRASSPWDLVLVGQRLYIAMAGTHQIWAVDLVDNRISVFAGNRREAALDGPNLRASFSQPLGLATDGKTLYVADSEASSIRAV